MYNLKLCWILYEEAVFEFRDGDAGGDRRSLTERISSPIISHNKAGKWKGSWMDADISRSGQRRVRSSLMNRLDRTLTITGWLSRRPQGPTYPCVCWWKLRLAVNVLMHDLKTTFKKKERSDLSHSLILRPLLYPSIQMGTAWDERISLYWTWLNAVLMKAYADNSFFIMSLARLGISFSIADRETSSDFHHRCFGCVPRRVFGILVFILHFCSIKRRADRDVGHERLYLRLKIDVYD